MLDTAGKHLYNSNIRERMDFRIFKGTASPNLCSSFYVSFLPWDNSLCINEAIPVNDIEAIRVRQQTAYV